MPFVQKPSCSKCTSTESTMWRKGHDGETFCCDCAGSELDGTEDPVTTEPVVEVAPKIAAVKEPVSSHFLGPLRKSSRIKPSKYKNQAPIKTLSTKGKGRRIVFKKNPIKAPLAVSTVITSNYIFHEGQYWQLGDIVSVLDEDGGIFYSQIRGFLQDQYCEKSIVITWLLPTMSSIPGKFDPATYIIGPEEDLPRPLSCFEFVMHAPSSYFYDKMSPYPTKAETPELSYICMTMGHEIRPLPSTDQIYGLRDLDDDTGSNPPDKIKVKQEGGRKRKPKDRKSQKGNKARGNLKDKGGAKQKVAADVLGNDDKLISSPLVIAEKGSNGTRSSVRDINGKEDLSEKPGLIGRRRVTRERNRSKKPMDNS